MNARNATIRILVLTYAANHGRITANDVVALAERHGDADGATWGGALPTAAEVSAVLAAMVKQRLVRFENGRYAITKHGESEVAKLSKPPGWPANVLFFRAPLLGVGTAVIDSIRDMTRLPLSEEASAPTGAFARIDAPTSVALGDEFTLVVGISPTPRPNVVGGSLDLQDVAYPFTLTIFVAPDRFALRPGEAALQRIDVADAEHFPTAELHLRAVGPLLAPDREERVIVVCYSVLARTIGYGSVTIEVLPADCAIAAQTQTIAPAIAGSVATGATPDMTITVLPVDSTSGLLHWKLESPHLDALPAPVESNMGTDGLNFAVSLARLIDTITESVPTLFRGISRRISAAMPPEFDARWIELREKLGPDRVPTVQIYTQEPYVPWELADVAPLFDTTAPRLLGAQAEVGRWVLGVKNRPPIPPPHDLELAPIATVTAVYADPSHQRLLHAEEEGRVLTSDYGAEPVDAVPAEVERCIDRGDPPARIVHFALHGAFDALPQYRGLVMKDGRFLSDIVVEGFDAKLQPFIFLNACEVGQGAEMLGHYGGIAAAFLLAGARGVIAPLWKIDDALAKEVALGFYPRAAAGDSPARYLRSVRGKFSERQPSPTYLAYLFFGHPALRAGVAVTTGDPADADAAAT